jgi:hypothetical protein
MENMLTGIYDFTKYRHRLLYWVAPIYIRYIPQICKVGRSLYHSRDRIVAASRPLQIYTESANPISPFFFVYIVKLSFRKVFLAVWLWNCKFIYCKITYLSWALKTVSEIISSGWEVSKNTFLIWQISFNGQGCDLQIHHCFLNENK